MIVANQKNSLPEKVHIGKIFALPNGNFYPFGKESRSSASSNKPREQFTGKERDAESGLDYFGARYYNADIARWISVDPKAGKYPSLTPYSYAANNPIIFVDPDGREVTAYTNVITSNLGLNILQFGVLPLMGRGGAQYLARHSYLHITTATRSLTIEIGGPREGSRTGDPIMTELGPGGEPGERFMQQEHDVTGSEGEENNYELENNILAIWDVIKDNLPDYNGSDGPNSNGLINWMVKKAGGKVNLPKGAYAKDNTAEYEKMYQKALKKKEKEKEAEKEKEEEKKREERRWDAYDPSKH